MKKLYSIFKQLRAKRPFVSVTVSQLLKGDVLSGKRIVITGGSRGLGFAMAKRFLQEGAIVLISGISTEHLNEAAKKLNNPRLFTFVYDVEDISQSNWFISQCERILGSIDIFVSNAGISMHEGSIFNVTPEGFYKTIRTNLASHFFLGKAFLSAKVKANSEGEGGGVVVYII